MGLVQRAIEKAGITTVCLSPIADLTRSVGAPRIAAIEHPPGRAFGAPGDSKGQTEVLRAALRVAHEAERPGSVVPLQFTWPDPPALAIAEARAPEPPPIAGLLKSKPWLLAKLVPRLVRGEIGAYRDPDS